MSASNRKDITGQRYGRLTAISYSHSVSGRAHWLCRCDCGGERVIIMSSLRDGITQSCGCLGKERRLAGTTKHGMFGTPIYNSWANMKRRCEDPKNKDYARYGGRGIRFCEKWRTFEGFYEDMGPSYKDGLTIERLRGDGHYEASNCTWANSRQQHMNRSISVVINTDFGAATLHDIATIHGINFNTVRRRYALGKRGPELWAPVKQK